MLLAMPSFPILFDPSFTEIIPSTIPIIPAKGAISKGAPARSWNGVILKNQFRIRRIIRLGIVKDRMPNRFPVVVFEEPLFMFSPRCVLRMCTIHKPILLFDRYESRIYKAPGISRKANSNSPENRLRAIISTPLKPITLSSIIIPPSNSCFHDIATPRINSNGTNIISNI